MSSQMIDASNRFHDECRPYTEIPAWWSGFLFHVLNTRQLSLYLYLTMLIDTNGVCNPTTKQIRQDLGLSSLTMVFESLRVLQDYGFILRNRRHLPDVGSRRNVYQRTACEYTVLRLLQCGKIDGFLRPMPGDHNEMSADARDLVRKGLQSVLRSAFARYDDAPAQAKKAVLIELLTETLSTRKGGQGRAGAYEKGAPGEFMATTPSDHWKPTQYQEHAAFVPAYGETLLTLLDPHPRERILDLGCGDGALTASLAALGCTVIGVDASPAMVEAARVRGLATSVMRAEELNFQREFDAVFTNAALHWVKDLDAAVAGVSRALKSGGRFVGEFGGFGNVAAIVVALSATLAARGIDARTLNPWIFPTPDDFRRLLERYGFEVHALDLIYRPTPLPTDMAGWIETFGAPFFASLSPEEYVRARDEAVALLEPALRTPDGTWIADYVRLRFSAALASRDGGP